MSYKNWCGRLFSWDYPTGYNAQKKLSNCELAERLERVRRGSGYHVCLMSEQKRAKARRQRRKMRKHMKNQR